MRVTRQIPVGLNRSNTILGIPTAALIGSLMAYGFCLAFPLGFIVKVALAAVLVAVLAGIKTALHGDERRPIVAWSAFWSRARYTRKRRKVFKLEVKA
jgi:type IV secretory pathway VirB3-like protein